MPKKITIITPSFNSENFIEKTINSVLEQKYSNLEYIIMDGGSTDSTISIIKKYKKYLKYWESKKDNGMYNALNKGFKKSSGELMGWLNSDDMLHPGCLSIVNQIFSEHKKVNWLTGTPNTRDKNDRIVKISSLPLWSKEIFYYDKIKSIQQESTFWRRNLWEKSGSKLNEQYLLASDHELWAKFFLHDNLYIVNALLGSFRKHGKQISVEKKEKYLAEVKHIRREHAKNTNNKGKINFLIKKIINKILPNTITSNKKYLNMFFGCKFIEYNFNSKSYLIK